MQTIDFIHPEDAAALDALKKIPVLYHPFTSVRVCELLKWTDTHRYKSLTYAKRIYPHCYQAIYDDWRFCQHCGKKI